tara:strand:+ start:388 stop:534 length:147 start_codon:yes stop_codon:yes gene_type:complete
LLRHHVDHFGRQVTHAFDVITDCYLSLCLFYLKLKGKVICHDRASVLI